MSNLEHKVFCEAHAALEDDIAAHVLEQRKVTLLNMYTISLCFATKTTLPDDGGGHRRTRARAAAAQGGAAHVPAFFCCAAPCSSAQVESWSVSIELQLVNLQR